MQRIRQYAALGLALTLPLAACDDSTGTSRQTTVLLSQGSSAAASLAPSFSTAVLSASAAAGKVSLDDVSAIQVTVTKVQALPASADENAESAWVSLNVSERGAINLRALPADAGSGIVLAKGELPAGDYRNVRLFLDMDGAEAPSITFNKEVTVGPKTYPAGTYPLDIPSAAQSGIKIPGAGFAVGETVMLMFDGSTSVANVVANPNGVKMSPVLKARSTD